MEQKYKVLKIQEMEFGCEELPEDAEVMVYVTLQAADGAKSNIVHSDALLYERNIEVGDEVILAKDKLEKVKK